MRALIALCWAELSGFDKRLPNPDTAPRIADLTLGDVVFLVDPLADATRSSISWAGGRVPLTAAFLTPDTSTSSLPIRCLLLALLGCFRRSPACPLLGLKRSSPIWHRTLECEILIVGATPNAPSRMTITRNRMRIFFSAWSGPLTSSGGAKTEQKPPEQKQEHS